MRLPSPPAQYVSQIEQAAGLIRQWIAAFNGLPELTFEVPPEGTVIIASLNATGRSYICKSPDSHALLEWLDTQMSGVLTVLQTLVALEIAGVVVPSVLPRINQICPPTGALH